MGEKCKALAALTAAAMELGVVGSVRASGLEDTKRVSYKYTQYREADLPVSKFHTENRLSSRSRYEIDIHQFLYQGPISRSTELKVSASTETMSGASPWYVARSSEGIPLQVMSGATISDSRTDLELALRNYTTATREYIYSFSYSTENDYSSLGLGYGFSKSSENQLHTIDLMANGAIDQVDATEADVYDRKDGEIKRSIGLSFGFSSIIHQNLLMSSSINYVLYSGYLSDPYKLAEVGEEGDTLPDSRPDNKNQFSWELSARRYLPTRDSALHLDYRFYQNSWEVESHTFELGWYFNLTSNWQIVPKVRYYSQTNAAFYQLFYTSTRADGYYSSDYRLSEFDAVSFKLKVNRKVDFGVFNIALEQYNSDGSHPGLVEFNRLSVGFALEFE